MPTDFEDFLLEGHELDFYGVCADCFKIDDMIFEAIRDRDDGYRSYLDSIRLKGDAETNNLTFFRRPIARIRLERRVVKGDFGGYVLVDINDGHVWLTVGTDYSDSYYPCFVFAYVVSTAVSQILSLDPSTRGYAMDSYLAECERLNKRD